LADALERIPDPNYDPDHWINILPFSEICDLWNAFWSIYEMRLMRL